MDDVHDMMDDIAEQQDVAREISDAISNPVAFGHDIDEVCSVNFHSSLLDIFSIIIMCDFTAYISSLSFSFTHRMN